jgi:anaerobic magnesium-protoporphyrin IX monomethyl ester cyclase
MRVLLFSMPDIYPEWLPMDVQCPSLALVSLAGNCPEHEVYVGDLILQRRNVKRAIMKALKRYQPNLIGLSAMTFQFPTLVKIAQFLKTLAPSIPIVVGGYHVTVQFEQLAHDPCSASFDFMIRGEGERTFAELVNALAAGQGVKDIQGLSYQYKGTWVHNPARPLEPIEHIRLPKRDARIWQGYHIFQRPLDTLETSRGCLNHCTFCSIKQMYGHTRREYPIGRVIQDIQQAKASGAQYLFFTDDNITSDARGLARFDALLDAMIAQKLHTLKYATQASSVSMGTDERIVKKMKQAGFDMVFLGIENTTARNLLSYKKGNILDYTERAITFLKRHGIIVVGGLVQGMEDDQEADVQRNIAYFMQSEVDIILGQILTPYPGTELREELVQKGLITNLNHWETYSGYFANIKTRHFSADELNFLQWKYLRQYHRWRARHFWKLHIFKNHPVYIIQTVLFKRLFRYFPLYLKRIGKDEQARFRISLEYNLSLNTNLL